ncbi:MAG: hypothetical protein V1826_01935 [bacterium]
MDNQIVNAVTKEVAGQAQQVADAAAKGIIERIADAYNHFVGIFPEAYQWIVSLILILAIASFLFSLIKRNWLWVVLLVVLFPGLLPILKNLFDSLTVLVTGKPQS